MRAMNKPKLKPFNSSIAVFRAGEHTSSDGTVVNITKQDLQDIVENFNGEDPVPHVIGHPKTNHPAYGWVTNLMVDGDVLFVSGSKQINPKFEQMVSDGSFKKRSVSIRKNPDDQWQLVHVGWLGAKAPAIDGLPTDFEVHEDALTLEFAVADSTTDDDQDFALSEDQGREVGWGFKTVAGILRRLKNRMIARDGLEAADEEIPEYQIEQLQSTGSNILESQNVRTYESPDGGDVDIKEDSVPKPKENEATFSAADVKAAEQRAADNARAQFQHDADCEAFVAGLVDDKKILPAQQEGFAQFMKSLGHTETLDFSADQEQTQLEFFKAFFESAKPLWKHLTEELVTEENDPGKGIKGDTAVERAQVIAKQAAEFVAAEAQAGRTITIAEAVQQVTNGEDQ